MTSAASDCVTVLEGISLVVVTVDVVVAVLVGVGVVLVGSISVTEFCVVSITSVLKCEVVVMTLFPDMCTEDVFLEVSAENFFTVVVHVLSSEVIVSTDVLL